MCADDFFKTLFDESDRGCVLLAAAALDNELEELHRAHIRQIISPTSKLLKELFRWQSPLGSFAARIQLGFAYGLIPENVYRDLEALRKLRNDCAHSIEDFRFSSPEVMAQVFALQLPRTPSSVALTEAETEAARNPKKTPETAKLYFLLAATQASNAILAKTCSIVGARID